MVRAGDEGRRRKADPDAEIPATAGGEVEGEGEADRKEESAGPRGGGGAKAVDDEAWRCEVGAEWRREVVGGMAGLEARSARGRGITPGLTGRGSWLRSPFERDFEAVVAEAKPVREGEITPELTGRGSWL